MLLRVVTSLLFIFGLGGSAPQQAGPPAKMPGFEISGTLVDANTGQPLGQAQVAIAPVTQRSNLTALATDETGRFLFANIAPGKYSLRAQARGYLTESFNEHDRFSCAIAVGDGFDSSDLVFRVSPEGAISGAVADEAGEPVAGARVILYITGLAAGIEATRQWGTTATDDEGSYRFGHLPRGRYLVAVVAQPWYAANQKSGSPLDLAYPVTFYGDVTNARSAAPIVLESGGKATANIDLHPAPALHLLANTLARGPVLESSVLDGQAATVTGKYTGFGPNHIMMFTVAPGRYIVKGAEGGSPGLAREIELHESGDIEKTEGRSYVAVKANVRFDPGVSLEKNTVSLRLTNEKTRQAFSERITRQGEIEIRYGVPPGSYEVGIVDNSDLFLKTLGVTGANATGRTIEVRAGANVHLDIAIGSGEGQITGTALRGGKPLAGAMVLLAPTDPAHNQILFVRDESDSDGTFILSRIVPGSYTLLAIENGWNLEWTNPAVLKDYLSKGLTVEVRPNGKYDLKVDVQ